MKYTYEEAVEEAIALVEDCKPVDCEVVVELLHKLGYTDVEVG